MTVAVSAGRIGPDVLEIESGYGGHVCGRARPVVIVLHGRGQHPEFAWRVAAAFGGVRILAPCGGVELDRGWTWFENRRVGEARVESVQHAEARFMGGLMARLPAASRPWLCGFSNGGAFAAHLLMRHPGRFSGAALLSAPLVLPPWAPGRLRGKAVFYARGDDDEIVPAPAYDTAQRYLLTHSGAEVSLHRYGMAHGIDAREMHDLARWFSVRRDLRELGEPS